MPLWERRSSSTRRTRGKTGERMRLTQLAGALPSVRSLTGDDVEVGGIVADSREVQPGNPFVAVTGVSVNEHTFIAETIVKGAVSAVGRMLCQMRSGAVPSPGIFTYVQVGDFREALDWLCVAWHGFPSRQVALAGVTATDGKRTTINLVDPTLSLGRQVKDDPYSQCPYRRLQC
jgi:UDP-N-acetylmuramyl tripeptide synthase